MTKRKAAQQFPVFPQMAVTVERDDVRRPDNGETAAFTRFSLRVAIQEIILWRDAAGRSRSLPFPRSSLRRRTREREVARRC